jgi:aminoglycoside 6'-N-acetyltransferase
MPARSSLVTGELTVVRPATEADADILVAWHADPEVARYWDDEQFTRDEMLLRLNAPDVDAYIVEAGGEPVGYLQAWFDSGPHAGVHDTSVHDAAGIDMFLIPSARGRGLGSDAAKALAERLVAGGAKRVTVDPYLGNDRAIRAWTKAGFEPVAEREPDDEHSRRWLEMEFREWA